MLQRSSASPDQTPADRRGPYGIVIWKEFIVERNGGPIMYAYQDTMHATALRDILDAAVGKPSDPIWQIAPFVDNPGTYGKSSYFFEWERCQRQNSPPMRAL